ncbi:TENX-like protein [Mya arenaria]|uniref:TENX-like protein n=1 Tax=Mya arenaria TaxID=6604 RepID=A0ABY7D9B6_MYAAR|nr:TENX-like protein [Mya arenaria]
MAWIQICIIALLLAGILQTMASDSDMDECHRLDKFICNVSRQCIPKVLVCNGYQECTENEDESPPTCTKEVCRRNERFFCDVSRMCIDELFVCTGYKDCTSALKRQCESNWSISEGCLGRCKPGYFGKNCEKTCSKQCLNGACNSSNGICKDCNPGYFGKYCQTCSEKCLNKICNSSSGICKDCSSGYFGKYCEKNCSNNCLNGICNRSNGICTDCKAGYFGKFCEKTCSKECLNGTCIRENGICEYCTRTYLESCSIECGQGCKEKDGFPQCDRQSGNCLNGCVLNYYGNYCNESCNNCKRNSSVVLCDNNGVCLYGCKNEYWDERCSSKCSANCKGDEQGNQCNSSTGECMNGCKPGWSGNLCGETMENYHYICEQNPPDHYDKVNDRPPCICSHCVRERVQPMLNRAPSCFSVVKPYATGGGDIRRTSSIHSYISNRELNTRRSITEYGSESGIVSTKEITDDSNSRRSITNSGGKDELDSAGKTKPRLGVTHSDSDLERVDKKNKTKGDTPRRCVAKSKSSIELVSTNDYLDLEALYQTAKEEDRRKLAAKYFDEGEEMFVNVAHVRN